MNFTNVIWRIKLKETEFDLKLKNYTSLINERLSGCIKCHEPSYKTVADAMNYSLLAGGKRLRPVLLLEFNRMCGGDTEQAMPFACAIEMIHTFSLIHDDLPCMDNDILRRGKPTCHVMFGEANALLAGDGLLALAFEIMSGQHKIRPDIQMSVIHEFARSTGFTGMIGGQTIDISDGNKPQTRQDLELLQSLKTGAIIKAACKAGCLLADADNKKVGAAERFADYIGLAFQIQDDILDITSSEKELGKSVGKDAIQEKITFPRLIGLQESIKTAGELTLNAIKELSVFDDAEFLEILSKKLMERRN